MGFSPAAYTLWSILACLFEGFLVFHLYFYDKFQCLKWGAGRQPGAFKRVMTYSYLATVPLLMVFVLALAVLSYGQGYVMLPNRQVLPLPFNSWTPRATSWLLPIFFVLSAGWALELVTHLEELTFWLFLIHQGPHKRNWFESWEFRVWYLGSVVAILGMPLTVIIKRHDLDMCFAWVFLAGSAAGLATTLCFIYVLIRFPAFIRRVKLEGAEPEVVVRLTIFYQLNITRIIFRFLFHFPLLILALDTVRGPHEVVSNSAASDLLCMFGGIGCFVSSAITLFIFFPRSITRETGYRVKISSTPSIANIAQPSALPDYHRERRHISHPKPITPTVSVQMHYPEEYVEDDALDTLPHEGEATPQYESDPESNYVDSSTVQGRSWIAEINGDATAWEMSDEGIANRSRRSRHRSRSRHGHDIEEQPSIGDGMNKYGARKGKGSDTGVVVIPHIPRVPPPPSRPMSTDGSSASRPSSFIHPYAMNFTSPIDLCDPDDDLIPRAV